jgi:multicomponent Na+:H+ antiporter subunit B
LKVFYLIIAVATGILLLYGAADMPNFGDPNAPANAHVSPRYIERSMAETEVPNMVTAVLADYRGYDTFGETAVVFTGAIACMLILRSRKKRKES